MISPFDTLFAAATSCYYFAMIRHFATPRFRASPLSPRLRYHAAHAVISLCCHAAFECAHAFAGDVDVSDIALMLRYDITLMIYILSMFRYMPLRHYDDVITYY